MKWRDHISTDPNVCHGQVRIKGTRIPVSVVLGSWKSCRSSFRLLRRSRYFISFGSSKTTASGFEACPHSKGARGNGYTIS
jgi:hypothetical protein